MKSKFQIVILNLYQRFGFALAAIALGSAIQHSTSAQSPWPSWRGPNGNGTAVEGVFPTTWSEESHVAWKVPLPGRGASTPLLVGNNIYLTLGKDAKNTLMCFSSKGVLEWEKTLGNEKPGKHAKASGSNSSPVTDGSNVFVYFKSGDIASLSLSGEINWSLNIQEKYGEDSLWWDLGTSPVLAGNLIVVTVMQTGPSFLVAFDKSNGKEVWKADRRLDVREEANQSYTTPTLTKLKQGDALITVGADHVTAHAVADGKLLWKQGGFNPANDGYFRSISSPVTTDGLVFCPYARGATLTALKTEVGLAGDQRIAWSKDFGSDVPTPAFSKGKLYLLGDKGLVSCLKPESGETLWTKQLPKSGRQYSSSPIVANGLIYCTREDATTFVISESDSGKLISENKLDGNAVATPVFAINRIYLRTFESLYCIE